MNLKAVLKHLAFGSAVFFSMPVSAYTTYTPNFNLMEEVKEHPYRILPHGENYSLAIDGDFFKPVFLGGINNNFYKYDFYHGNGYWVALRSEFKVTDQFRLNLKFDVTHGTSSNGPSYFSMIIPHAGMTYLEKGLLGFDWEIRLSDIGRQTIGTGLFIEQKETEGGSVVATRGDFEGKVMIDGTGSYRLEGGIVVLDANFWKGLVGGTFFLQEVDTDFHPPATVWTLYSKHDLGGGFSYGLEGGGDRASTAGMSYVQWDHSIDRFHFWVKPQARYYGKGLLGSLPQHVMHNYVSYDQNDKAFTTLMDIFAYGDHVITYSSQVNAEYSLNDQWQLYAETESFYFHFLDRRPVNSVMYRAGVKYFPFKGREDELGMLVGNKYYIASTSQVDITQLPRDYSRPNFIDSENRPLFLEQLYWMVNYSFKL